MNYILASPSSDSYWVYSSINNRGLWYGHKYPTQEVFDDLHKYVESQRYIDVYTYIIYIEKVNNLPLNSIQIVEIIDNDRIDNYW